MTLANKPNNPQRMSHIVWAVSGVALGCAAILSFCAPGAQLIYVMPWLGGAMLLSGLSYILLYSQRYYDTLDGKWMLADGLTASLLSFFLLFNQVTSVAILPFFFCVWELFSGVLKVTEAIEHKSKHVRGWQWFYTVGAIELISGVAALFKPVEEALTMHVVIGIVLLIQSVPFLHKAFVIPLISSYKR